MSLVAYLSASGSVLQRLPYLLAQLFNPKNPGGCITLLVMHLHYCTALLLG